MKCIGLLCVLFGLVACSDGSGPASGFHLSFDVAQLDSVVVQGDTVWFSRGRSPSLDELDVLRETRPIVTITEAGTIHIAGSFVAPCAGNEPHAAFARAGGMLRLRIGYETGRVCLDSVTAYTYEARITAVPPGAHRLVVEHDMDTLWGSGVVLDEALQVP